MKKGIPRQEAQHGARGNFWRNQVEQETSSFEDFVLSLKFPLTFFPK
jgi:hypothetical protein